MICTFEYSSLEVVTDRKLSPYLKHVFDNHPRFITSEALSGQVDLLNHANKNYYCVRWIHQDSRLLALFLDIEEMDIRLQLPFHALVDNRYREEAEKAIETYKINPDLMLGNMPIKINLIPAS
jgi:hypothetical protein